MKDEYEYDIKKLKNYKVIDSHFESPLIKRFVNCVLKSESEDDVEKCGNYYHCDKRGTEHEYFSVQSAGDSRCSGKSEILYLMFPSALKNTPFGQEEENPDNPTSKPLENEMYSIHGDYHPPDEDTLSIYVKRDFDEKRNCLATRAMDDDSSLRVLPNELLTEDSQEVIDLYRKNNLPQLTKQKNYMLMENMNPEKEVMTAETTCDTANKRIDEAIGRMKRSLSIDEDIVKMGIYKDAHKKFFEQDTSSVNRDIQTTKEYTDMCNLDNKYQQLESIIDKRRKIAEQHCL